VKYLRIREEASVCELNGVLQMLAIKSLRRCAAEILGDQVGPRFTGEHSVRRGV